MRKLSLWVEGASDRRFFEWTIKPKLTQHFNVVRIEEYSGRASKVNNFLQSRHVTEIVHFRTWTRS
jgi:hypothetical protein